MNSECNYRKIIQKSLKRSSFHWMKEGCLSSVKKRRSENKRKYIFGEGYSKRIPKTVRGEEESGEHQHRPSASVSSESSSDSISTKNNNKPSRATAKEEEPPKATSHTIEKRVRLSAPSFRFLLCYFEFGVKGLKEASFRSSRPSRRRRRAGTHSAS